MTSKKNLKNKLMRRIKKGIKKSEQIILMKNMLIKNSKVLIIIPNIIV